jgi:hypothetical protein
MKQDLAFENTHPHLNEFMQLLKVSNNESDRGAVLVHADMLDGLLKRSIEAYLLKHKDIVKLTNGFNSPIGTLSARALLAFAVGVISEREYHEIELIRKIRNGFAHSIDMSFDNQRMAAHCAALTFAADGPEAPRDPRGRFKTSVFSLTLNLVNRPHYASQRRLSYQEWHY